MAATEKTNKEILVIKVRDFFDSVVLFLGQSSNQI